jgi:hypothetical protein
MQASDSVIVAIALDHRNYMFLLAKQSWSWIRKQLDELATALRGIERPCRAEQATSSLAGRECPR